MSCSAAPTESFDVIVVGGGHAGCEAAITAARLGLNTALFSLNLDRIAWQPCNPAVGGPAKEEASAPWNAGNTPINWNSCRSYNNTCEISSTNGLNAMRRDGIRKIPIN